MDNIVLLVGCLLAGYLLRRTPLFDEKAPLVLNNLVVYLFIPCLTLSHVPKIHFNAGLVWLSITPFVVYLGAILYVKAMARLWPMSRAYEGALIMTSGIGSISFVGFPVFEILYGEEGLAYGIILSLAGTFLVFNTVGIATGLYYSGKAQSAASIAKKVLSFPPMLAFLLAIMANLVGWEPPILLANLFARLSAPFSVLALLAIGMQIDFSVDKGPLKLILLGQAYKLILAPAIVYVLMWHVLGQNGLVAKVCIVGAGIGSMNAISIVAAQLGLAPRLATLMPTVGIPISIPILFLIDFCLR